MFADDLALLADSIENLQLLIILCAKWVFWAGLKFNASKCKILIITPKNYAYSTDNHAIFLPTYTNNIHTVNPNTRQKAIKQDELVLLLQKVLQKTKSSLKNVSEKQFQIICDHINNWSMFINNQQNTNRNNIQIQNIQLLNNTNLVILNITQEGDGCKYLGIIQQNGSTYLKQRNKIVANSKSAMCKLMNFHEIGAANNIELSITMYQTITRAIMLVGSETLNLSESFIENTLESIQHKSLCFIFGVYICVFKPFLRLLAGLPPIIAIWHFNRLKAYFKVILNPNNLQSIATDVAREDLKLFKIEMANPNNKIAGTMTDEIWELLMRYSIQSLFHLLSNNSNQHDLNVITNKVKSTIWSHFWQADFEAIKGAATLNYFNIQLLNNSSRSYHKAKLIKWTQYSNNRNGVRWLYRVWSERIVNTFYNEIDPKYCCCKHCKKSINHLYFIKHIIKDCIRLKKTRKDCQIDTNTPIKELLNDNNTNIHNMIKFLSKVMDK